MNLASLVALPITSPGGMPTPAAAGSAEVTTVILGLFLLFIGAKIGDEVARRLGQPGVIGELAGGFLVGPHALALVVPGETAAVLGEIGVVILLFGVGLEIRTDDLLSVGKPAILTAIIGVVAPIAAGMGYALLTGQEVPTAAFVGLALAATSIGITGRVLSDLGVMDRRFARIIIGAAVIDDILALVLIGVVSGAATGDLSIATLGIAVAAVGFVGLGFATARRARGLPREVFTFPLFANTPLVPAFIFMLGLALVGVWLGLAAIIGAFVAGLIVAETEAQDEVEHEVKTLSQIFAPFFFAVTGASVQLDALLRPELAIAAVVLALLGIVTKVVGGLIGAREAGRWSSLAVGVGMAPRGEVGIVVVTLGQGLGFLTADLFSTILVAVVLTTVAAPLLLKVIIPRAAAETAAAETAAAETAAAETAAAAGGGPAMTSQRTLPGAVRAGGSAPAGRSRSRSSTRPRNHART